MNLRNILMIAPAVVVLNPLIGTAHSKRPIKVFSSDDRLSGLSWMIGTWVSREEGRQVDEHWTHAAGGTMMGVSRTVSGDRTVFFEFLRIEVRPEGTFYLAAPQGRNPATPFKQVELGEHRVVFENQEHDFPQRISYWIADDGLMHGRIEGVEQGKEKSSEWTYVPARVVVE